MKTIAILFSDLHLGEYAKFNTDNQRTLSHFRVLSFIRKAATRLKCPVIFAGDLFHRPEVITNELLQTTFKMFIGLDTGKWKMYAISGNHDCSLSNTIDRLSPSWVSTFSSKFDFLECIDNDTIELESNGIKFTVSGIPYLDHNKGLNQLVNQVKVKDKNHILVLHTDYPGAKDTDGTEVDTVENLNTNLLSKFRLTLIGHIHKPQRLGKKVFMLGAPLQQRRTDRNCDLGYWELKEDFSMVFVSLSDKFPKFIDVSDESEIKEDGNYYTITISDKQKDSANNISHGISKDISRSKIARKYLKVKGIDDKAKRKVLVKILNAAE